MLDALGEADGEIGTNELARRTGINASSVSRLLATLVDAGYAEPTANGRYRLGVRLLQLGSRALDGLDLRALARPALEALAAETGETATLSVSGGRDAVTLDFARSPQAVQSVAQLGRPSVAHATATGKVLLAFGDVPLPAGRLAGYTPRTITDRAPSSARSSACAGRAGPRRSRSARPTSRPSRRRCAGRAASSRRSSACRAR